MDEGSGKREEPDDGRDDADASDDFGVDEASLVPRGRPLDLVEVVAVDARHDGCEGQLRQAEDHREEVNEQHLSRLG